MLFILQLFFESRIFYCFCLAIIFTIVLANLCTHKIVHCSQHSIICSNYRACIVRTYLNTSLKTMFIQVVVRRLNIFINQIQLAKILISHKTMQRKSLNIFGSFSTFHFQIIGTLIVFFNFLTIHICFVNSSFHPTILSFGDVPKAKSVYYFSMAFLILRIP